MHYLSILLNELAELLWNLTVVTVVFTGVLSAVYVLINLVKKALLPKKQATSLKTYHSDTTFQLKPAIGKRAHAKPVAVLDFTGDVMASQQNTFAQLVDEVVLNKDKLHLVVVKVDSPGGGVADYGRVFAEMVRLRQTGLHLIACVDRFAASGGYLMSLPATKIIAAPFAFVGSVGVVAEAINVHEALKRVGIRGRVFTAGDRKRTITTTGDDTPESEKYFEQQLKGIHEQFLNKVAEYRGDKANMDAIKTADHWTAEESMKLNLGLVDALGTSSEVLMELNSNCDLLLLKKKPDYSKKFMDKFNSSIREQLVIPLLQKFWNTSI